VYDVRGGTKSTGSTAGIEKKVHNVRRFARQLRKAPKNGKVFALLHFRASPPEPS